MDEEEEGEGESVWMRRKRGGECVDDEEEGEGESVWMRRRRGGECVEGTGKKEENRCGVR